MTGCNGNTFNINEMKVGKEIMRSSIFVEPSINLTTDKNVSIIIEFKTKPAVVAVKEAEAQGIQLSLEEAKKNVEESHAKFKEELNMLLDQNNIKYSIKHTYKTALNGVSMDLPGNAIKRLMESTVIARIYLNKEIHLFPPITPGGQM